MLQKKFLLIKLSSECELNCRTSTLKANELKNKYEVSSYPKKCPSPEECSIEYNAGAEAGTASR